MQKMEKYRIRGKSKGYPSLFDAFELGDRVERVYIDKNGKNKIYKGIILAIDDDSIEIYWDTKDGKYRPKDMEIAFTNCPIAEIFNGTSEYSPIKKDNALIDEY